MSFCSAELPGRPFGFGLPPTPVAATTRFENEQQHGHDLPSVGSAKPEAMLAASSRNAACVFVTELPRALASAPASRCGSQGMRTQARQRLAKCASIRSRSTKPVGRSHRVEDGDRAADEVLVAVLLEPVERRARGARAVEARRAHDDDLVGRVENPARRRFEDAGPGVEADEVVVALEQSDRPLELGFADRLRDARVVVRRDDLEPSRRLRRVAADVCVPLDPVGVGEKRRQVRGRLAADPVPERARVRVPVDGDDPVAAVAARTCGRRAGRSSSCRRRPCAR